MEKTIMKNKYFQNQMEGSALKVGGNKRTLWLGELIRDIGNSLLNSGNDLINKSKPMMVTNPTARLVNPFTLLINFVVNNNQKYQVIIQGDYKEKFRESKENDDSVNISDEDLFLIIYQSQSDWFKKE